MKKILIMLQFLILCGVASAQFTNFNGTVTNPVGATSKANAVLNATVDTLLFTNPGYYSTATISAYLSKTSGTIAGTVRLYGSEWNTTGTWYPVGDTATLANQSVNEHKWTLTDEMPIYKYYMILQSGGTTMAGTLKGNVFAVKP